MYIAIFPFPFLEYNVFENNTKSHTERTDSLTLQLGAPWKLTFILKCCLLMEENINLDGLYSTVEISRYSPALYWDGVIKTGEVMHRNSDF